MKPKIIKFIDKAKESLIEDEARLSPEDVELLIAQSQDFIAIAENLLLDQID